MTIQNIEYDEIDRKIACILMHDAHITSSNLGELVGLSSSAANERVRKLKNDGIIKKISAFINADFINMGLGAFIFVVVDGKENNDNFMAKAITHGNILECHHITGEYSYLLKVRVANTKILENFINDFLKAHAGVTKTMTQVILSSPKEFSVIIE